MGLFQFLIMDNQDGRKTMRKDRRNREGEKKTKRKGRRHLSRERQDHWGTLRKHKDHWGTHTKGTHSEGQRQRVSHSNELNLGKSYSAGKVENSTVLLWKLWLESKMFIFKETCTLLYNWTSYLLFLECLFFPSPPVKVSIYVLLGSILLSCPS